MPLFDKVFNIYAGNEKKDYGKLKKNTVFMLKFT